MKKLLAALLVFVMIGALAACGATPASAPSEGGSASPSQGADAPAGEEVEITIWTFLNVEEQTGRGKVLKDVVDMYEAAYPNVKVTVESQQWDTLTGKIFAAHQTGTAPDILWINGADLGQAIQLGVLEPLENCFMGEWTPEQIADIDDARFQYGATDDAHYQIHMSTNAYGLVYRKDLFEQYDIDPNFESWDDLLEAAKTLTFTDPDTGMEVWGLGAGYNEESADSIYLTAALFTEFGGVVDDEGKANWAGDVGQEALQRQIDMIDTLGVMPSSCIAATSDEVYADFMAGKFAMIFGGSVRIPTVKEQSVFDPDYVGLMPYPSLNGKPGRGLGSGWNVGVWSGSEHKSEAGLFIEMMCSPEADLLWVTEAGQIPLLKSTIEATPDFFSQPENEYLAVAAGILENNAVTHSTKFVISGYNKDLSRAMQLAYVDGMSVQDALETTAQEFNERNAN